MRASASRKARYSPRATAAPLLRASETPLRGARTSVTSCGWACAKASTMAAVSSVLPLSATMISTSAVASSSNSYRSRSTTPASLRVGMTMLKRSDDAACAGSFQRPRAFESGSGFGGIPVSSLSTARRAVSAPVLPWPVARITPSRHTSRAVVLGDHDLVQSSHGSVPCATVVKGIDALKDLRARVGAAEPPP